MVFMEMESRRRFMQEIEKEMSKKCLIIVHSYHHNNTLKIANAFSKVLKAKATCKIVER